MNEVIPKKWQQILKEKNRYQGIFRRFLTFQSSGGAVRNFLGADVFTVREWIESNFVEGMTWDNYGKFWVVDHIVPMRCFNIFDEAELVLCWHYKNLMPLLKKDNEKKQGAVFISYQILLKLKDKDVYFKKLFDKIEPEFHWMCKYVDIYHAKYNY